MSPRAACRLETLGFSAVYDYVGGKVDWLARGLPREGEKAGECRALDLAVADVVTCQRFDQVSEVAARVAASPFGFAFVVSPGRTLLGRLRRAALETGGDATAEALMEPGRRSARTPRLRGLPSGCARTTSRACRSRHLKASSSASSGATP